MWSRSGAAKATFTRPADTTPYSIGDLVANSVTAGSVVPLQFDAPDGVSFSQLTAARIEKTDKTTTNASFDLYLYETSPTVAAGDNSAPAIAALSGYLGKVSITVGTAGGTSGASGSVSATALPVTGKSVYGLLLATAAYTPVSAEVFTVSLFNFG